MNMSEIERDDTRPRSWNYSNGNTKRKDFVSLLNETSIFSTQRSVL